VDDGLRNSDCVEKCATKSRRPSPLTSSNEYWNVPLFLVTIGAPANLTLAGSTVVASNVWLLSIATGTLQFDPRLMLFGTPSGLISIEIGMVLPELPALKSDCISVPVRARLNNSTSSIRPLKNCRWPSEPSSPAPIRTGSLLVNGAETLGSSMEAPLCRTPLM